MSRNSLNKATALLALLALFASANLDIYRKESDGRGPRVRNARNLGLASSGQRGDAITGADAENRAAGGGQYRRHRQDSSQAGRPSLRQFHNNPDEIRMNRKRRQERSRGIRTATRLDMVLGRA